MTAKILPLLSLLLLTLTGCGSSSRVYTDRYLWMLEDEVKMCHIMHYEAEKHNGKILKARPKEGYVLHFTKEGWVESAEAYGSDGYEVEAKLTVEFDADGYPESRRVDGPEEMASTWEITYEDGDCVKCVGEYDNGTRYREECEYDDHHLKTMVTHYIVDGNDYGAESEFEYDDDILSKSVMTSDDYTTTIYYRDWARPTQIISDLCDTCNVRYDAKGNITNIENGRLMIYIMGGFSINSTDPAECSFDYKFDDRGNWTKCTIFDGDGDPESIIERKIQYW